MGRCDIIAHDTTVQQDVNNLDISNTLSQYGLWSFKHGIIFVNVIHLANAYCKDIATSATHLE